MLLDIVIDARSPSLHDLIHFTFDLVYRLVRVARLSFFDVRAGLEIRVPRFLNGVGRKGIRSLSSSLTEGVGEVVGWKLLAL